MTDQHIIDHVAFIVPSIEPVLDEVDENGWSYGDIEHFPNEGTRECYVGDADGARILLMEPTSDGPYASALERRGPGLHHVALHVQSIDTFLRNRAADSGWLLHPLGFETRQRSSTIWLARPGVASLVEVHESGHVGADSWFVERVEIPGVDSHDGLQQLFDGCGVPVAPGKHGRAFVAGTPFHPSSP